MLNWILGWFGYKIVYESGYGTHDRKYDITDYRMGRPIHKDMSVAPPWAKMRIVRNKP